VIWNDKDCGPDNDAPETHTWTIVSAKGLTVGVGDGTVVRMQRGDVTLIATVRRIPHFNLTEDAFNGKNAKFALQLSSETSV
jgi:vang-like